MIAGARLAGSGRDSKTASIFVHGVGSTAAIWDYQLEALGNDGLCAAIELRGNGASKPDPDPSLITREGFAADVLAVADALGVRRFTLVGCSLGGVVAFELWQQAPERIERLVLVSTFARYPDGERYAQQIGAQVREAGDMRAFGERRAAMLGLPPARLRETIDQMACKSVDCYLAATQATWTGDYRALLPGIGVPALVIFGERDAVVPRVLAEEIASGIRGAQLAMIPNAGHVANADQPAEFNRLLREFLIRRRRPDIA
jgi:3-oxoadipate enol-lactonase